jgi:cysteine desulfuration protein SufE
MGQPRPRSGRQGTGRLIRNFPPETRRGARLIVPTELDAIVAELAEADNSERTEILIEFARKLPPLPDRLAEFKDEAHRVPECQSPVYLFVELDEDRVRIHADAPIEAPTVRAFVAILVEGLNGTTYEDVLTVPGDLIQRSGLVNILGMLRANGLTGVLNRLKRAVTAALAERSADPLAP